MSMDDTHRKLRRFKKDLESFNSALRNGVTALQKAHEGVSPLWRDEFRAEYDRRWRSFSKGVQHYLNRDMHKYTRFLDTKIRHIARYLGHGR